MALFGMRLRRPSKYNDRDYDLSSSDSEGSDSDLEDDMSHRSRHRTNGGTSGWGWGFSSSYESKKSSKKKKSKISQLRRAVLKAVRLLPKTSQGWGVLLLTTLVFMYLMDFYSLSKSTDTPSMQLYTGDLDKGSKPEAAAAPAAPKPAAENVSPKAEEVVPKKEPVEKPKEPENAPNGSKGESDLMKLVGSQNAASQPAAEQKKPEPIQGTVNMASSTSPFSRENVGLWVPSGMGRVSMDQVKLYYRKLAQKYLEPFVGGISRDKFFDILARRMYSLTPNGANKGTNSMFIQIKDKRIYMLDPYEVPKNAKPYHRSRINQLIYLLSNLARQGRVPDTEFLVTIHDCVQTNNRDHTYRAARSKENIVVSLLSLRQGNPGFTIVGCNFSDNIPFPMWEGDDTRGGGYAGWNEQMKEYAKDEIPWSTKQSKAVFRGGVRPSTVFSTKEEADLHCDEAGRSALAKKSELRPDILDVSVGGKCGGKKYNLSRLEPRDHHKYKFVIYAEGNCFWADRINRQLFGPSVIIKQETPCGQFFEPLLQPGVHYMPTDFYFNNLEEQIEKAKANDELSQRIVREGNDFAWNFLSAEGIATYAEVLLEEYTKLLMKPAITVDTGAKDVTDTQV